MGENKGIMLAKSVQKHAGRAKEKFRVAFQFEARVLTAPTLSGFGLVPHEAPASSAAVAVVRRVKVLAKEKVAKKQQQTTEY
ncbi:unnamed protein product [Ceratitis capitata]|uniref:(Mediterranean fruit fly) hypothetical protein n=1 Tax=Ceratitis capitata TaxID=7213 RepID=A0A811VEM7_CERCA|nr:unnamed protein product [Ceratitis capitata]